MDKVGVVGLGYVGLPLLGSLASVGFDVVGVDINQAKVRQLASGGGPDFYESGLSEILERYRSRIVFTTSHADALMQCHTLIVTVGTDLKADGTPNLDGLTSLRDAIAPHLAQGHLLVLKSTVPVGTTRRIASELEQASGLVAGQDFFVAYSPERTIEGHALHELRFLPKIIGGLNAESAERTRRVLGRLGGETMVVSSPDVAEMCKLVDNTYRATNIAFANEVGRMCEAMGIDSYELVSAINDGYDRTSLFRAGLGAGGPCLSKDPAVLALSAEAHGVDAQIIKLGIASNRDTTVQITQAAAEYIRKYNIEPPRVALLGLAFKGLPETDDIRSAPAVLMQEQLAKEFPAAQFSYYDPIIESFAGQQVSSTVPEALREVNVAVFLTNHASLSGTQSTDVLEALTARPALLIDCWHNIDDPACLVEAGIDVIRIGDGTI